MAFSLPKNQTLSDVSLDTIYYRHTFCLKPFISNEF